jgi:hypothetical protein
MPCLFVCWLSRIAIRTLSHASEPELGGPRGVRGGERGDHARAARASAAACARLSLQPDRLAAATSLLHLDRSPLADHCCGKTFRFAPREACRDVGTKRERKCAGEIANNTIAQPENRIAPQVSTTTNRQTRQRY